MRFRLLVFLALLLSVIFTAVPAQGQSTTVSGTITDAAAQAWINGTYRIEFYQGSANPPFYWNGAPFPNPPVFTGNLDGTGSFSGLSIPSNNFINPPGSQWKFTVCPAASAPCFTQPVAISGASQSVSGSIVPPAIQVQANAYNQPTAYADSEIVGAVPGFIYFNLVTNLLRQCNNPLPCVWANSGGAAAVSSVFGRTGAVVAQTGDYTAAQVTNSQASSDTFFAATHCNNLTNCVQWVDDDTTDNCGAATTSWVTAINAVSTGDNLKMVHIIIRGGGGPGFLLKTCQLNFIVPHEVWLQATLDFGTTQTPTSCITAGPTGMTNYNTGGTSIAWRWHGGTITGCTAATSYGMESFAWQFNGYLYDMAIRNFGPAGNAAGVCTKSAIKLDVIAEAHIYGIEALDNRAGWCFSANTQDCGSQSSCGSPSGQNTLHMSSMSIGVQPAPCGSVGHLEGGSHSTMVDVSLFGFGAPFLMALTTSGTGGGWMVHGGTIDSAGCLGSGSVSAAIQIGHNGTGVVQGPLTIQGVEIPGAGATHTANLFAIAGNSTDTIIDIAIQGNIAENWLVAPFLMPNGTSCAGICFASQNPTFIPPLTGNGWNLTAASGPLQGADYMVRPNTTQAGNWTPVPAVGNIVTCGTTTVNQCFTINTNSITPGNLSGLNAAIYDLQNVDNDQFSEAQVAAVGSAAGDKIYAAVRMTTGGNSYAYACNGNSARAILKFTAGVSASQATGGNNCVATDILRLEVTGSNPAVLNAYYNGALDITFSDSTSPFAAGSPGILIFETTSANTDRWKNWNGGSLYTLGSAARAALTSALLRTTTNCAAVGTAASPSVASCGASSAGSFSCATNASGATCQVNTTAVTANSEIFITQRSDTTTGTRLGVTCNATLTTVIPEITAVTAATSFTINLGTITTNPECFSYWVVN